VIISGLAVTYLEDLLDQVGLGFRREGGLECSGLGAGLSAVPTL
jgi:hypothetical protein